MIKLTFVLFLLVNKEAQTSTTELYSTEVNSLEQRSANVFAFPIEVIPRKEAAPVAPDGNHLNEVPVPASLQTTEHFQAIPINYSIEDGDNTNKKNKSQTPTVKSDLSSYPQKTKNVRKRRRLKGNQTNDVTSSVFALVWDNCLENVYQKEISSVKPYEYDMEHANHVNEHSNILQETMNENEFWNEGVKKRNTNNSAALQVLLSNYIKDTKSEERRQFNSDVRIVKIPILDQVSTTVNVIPITRDIFKESINEINAGFNVSVTDETPTSYTEDWFETKDKVRKTKIKFGGLPHRETYLVPTLKLEEGFYPFSFVSEFFSVLRPFEYPVGLVNEILWGKFTFPYSFLLSIKIESVFLVFIIIFICIALIIPSYLIIVGFLALLSSDHSEDQLERGALFPELEDSKCNSRVLAVVTLFMVLVCCALIAGMIISNEQAALSTSESRDVLNCACADIAAWLSAAARELHLSLIPPVDLVLQAFKDDLRNVDLLLGEPIQKTISAESGIDLVLESLNDIISESEDLATKISSLRDVSIQAGSLASASSDRLKDLSRQLGNLKKHCLGKDVKLCDTINTNSLELRMKFDLILREQQLSELRSLGVENLTRAIALAKQEFRTLPTAISVQTTTVREDILRDMEVRRELIYRSSRVLNDIVRYLTAVLHSAARIIDAALDRFQDYDVWRWLIMLCCTILFGLVMALLLCGMTCGCGKAKGHARRTLKVSAFFTCFASLVLWIMISATFLIAGHAEVYVCHPLWDFPQYDDLSKLLDRPSPVFQNNEGIFDALFRDMENVTIDASIKDVLRDCEQDRPAYTVFRLDKVLDVNKETSYFEWDELQADLGRLSSSLDIDFLSTISANLSKLLAETLVVSDVQLAQYRMEYNGPVVGKDLISLADQLENVAAQVADLTTSSRLEALATRTKRIHTTNIKPLEQYRADVVFKLTELELRLMPFRRKLNISLSHIHTAQFYIDNQGEVIAQKKLSIYANRLISHVAGWRTHVLNAAETQAARCKPLFAVYSATRALLCSQYVASLNGWWVCGLLLGLSWCALMPLCVRLWRTYGRMIRADDAMNMANLTSGHQETPTTAVCDSSNWNAPGPPPPPRNDSW